MRRGLIIVSVLSISLSSTAGCSGTDQESTTQDAENAAMAAADAATDAMENVDSATDDEHRKPVNAADIGEN